MINTVKKIIAEIAEQAPANQKDMIDEMVCKIEKQAPHLIRPFAGDQKLVAFFMRVYLSRKMGVRPAYNAIVNPNIHALLDAMDV